jgi:hypothetical protein
MGVIVRRDDRRGMMVKRNNGGEWSSYGVVLYLVMRQKGDVVSGEESDQG